MYQFRADNDAVFPARDAEPEWVVRIRGKINGGLSLVGNTLYATSFDRHVYAIRASDGRVLWRTPVNNVTMTAPVSAQGIVIVGTGTNRVLWDTPNSVVWGRPRGDEVVAVNGSTGKTVWKYHTIGEDMPTPAIVNPNGANASVIFSNGDGHVKALDLKTGRLLWSRYVGGVATMSSTAIWHGDVFGGENRSINYIFSEEKRHKTAVDQTWTWAIRASDGRLLWRAFYGSSDCSPTVANGRVFVSTSRLVYPIGTGDTTSYTIVYALRASDGKLLWRYVSGRGLRDPAGTNEDAIAGTYHSGVFYDSLPFARRFAAFDAASGRLLWTIRTSNPVKMSAIATGGRLFFGDTGGHFYVVDAARGRVLSKTKFPSFFDASPPVVAGGALFVANDRRVYAIPVRAITAGKFDPPA